MLAVGDIFRSAPQCSVRGALLQSQFAVRCAMPMGTFHLSVHYAARRKLSHVKIIDSPVLLSVSLTTPQRAKAGYRARVTVCEWTKWMRFVQFTRSRRPLRPIGLVASMLDCRLRTPVISL